MKWKIVDWVVRALIALAFFPASLVKLTSHPATLERFSRFGYPDGFYLLVGILELAGAVLILLPKTRYLAIAILATIVLGAAVTHVLHDPLAELIRPLVFAVFLVGAWFLPTRIGDHRKQTFPGE